MNADKKDVMVEKFESLSHDESQGKGMRQTDAMGSVALLDAQEIYLVPSPSADPQGNEVGYDS